jgi:hypothetical protein
MMDNASLITSSLVFFPPYESQFSPSDRIDEKAEIVGSTHAGNWLIVGSTHAGNWLVVTTNRLELSCVGITKAFDIGVNAAELVSGYSHLESN